MDINVGKVSIPESVIRLVLLALGSAKKDNERYLEILSRRVLSAVVWYELYVSLERSDELRDPAWAEVKRRYIVTDLGRRTEKPRPPDIQYFLDRPGVLAIEAALSEVGKLSQKKPFWHSIPRTQQERRRYDRAMFAKVRNHCAEQIFKGAKATLDELIFMYARSSRGDRLLKDVFYRILAKMGGLRFEEIHAALVQVQNKRRELHKLHGIKLIQRDGLEASLANRLCAAALTPAHFITLHRIAPHRFGDMAERIYAATRRKSSKGPAAKI
ncbi:MAG: hypothetical protein WCW31_00925 [Patescibacteria group bacterium]